MFLQMYGAILKLSSAYNCLYIARAVSKGE